MITLKKGDHLPAPEDAQFMTTDELYSYVNEYFENLVGFRPRNFQRATILKILIRQDVLLRAPTGSGKTETAIALLETPP